MFSEYEILKFDIAIYLAYFKKESTMLQRTDFINLKGDVIKMSLPFLDFFSQMLTS